MDCSIANSVFLCIICVLYQQFVYTEIPSEAPGGGLHDNIIVTLGRTGAWWLAHSRNVLVLPLSLSFLWKIVVGEVFLWVLDPASSRLSVQLPLCVLLDRKYVFNR